MKYLSKNMSVNIFVVYVMLAFLVINSFVYIGFVHYEAQYRSLQPHTYQIDIITAEDFALLSDPSKESVALSDGSKFMDRQPAFYEHTLPNYKKVDGGYVLVTTLGTSHFYYRWMTEMVPFALLIAAGLVLSFINLRRPQPVEESGV